MKKKFFSIIIILVILLIGNSSYNIAQSEIIYKSFKMELICDYNNTEHETITANMNNTKDTINEDTVDNKVEFISDIANLTTKESKYLIEECESKDLDIFLVLGLMKLESKFDKKAVGSMGERGLGQLMANTAKPVAENLGMEYDPELLFQPKYNIKLFTTQLRYLKQIFDNDTHKMLTAYNRGEYGLKKYMASRSRRTNPAISTYSAKVLKFSREIYEEYESEYM